jgi:hypothetical protein
MRKRLLPFLAVAVCFVVAIVWIGSDRTAGEHAFDDYSVENTSPTGVSIAFRYLQRRSRHVTRLDTPLGEATLPANGVVIRAGVLAEPSFAEEEEVKPKAKKKGKKREIKLPERLKRVTPLLTGEEEEWVRRGGRLVLATAVPFGPLDVRGGKNGAATKVFPIWPSVPAISVPVGRAFTTATLDPRMHALFTVNGEPAIARESIGAGEVIVMSIPEVLQNESLRRRGALPLLEALAPSNRPVYFDESIHGFDDSAGTLAILKGWSLGPMLLLAALAALLYFWRNAKRLGPPEDDVRETRSDAIDLVGSLGTLYMSTMTDDEAIATYREALVRSVAVQTGLRGDALYRRVSDLTKHDVAASGSRRMKAAAFRRHLNIINEAFRKLEHGRSRRAAGVMHANNR